MVYNIICDKHASFEECELAILREAVDKAELVIKKNKIKTPEVDKIIDVVEQFLKKKKLICYGGTAINNILPKDVQFYDKEIEIPDYDFFSPEPLKHVQELADIYHKKGFLEVEAKAGQHHGTYKLFVNFIPVADITYLNKIVFDSIKKESIIKNNIYYSPPNFLRMLIYLELSRPAGNVERWEKVLKRLILLNKYHPMKEQNCQKISYQRVSDFKKKEEEKIFNLVKNELINQEVVFFGGYAMYLYSTYMSKTIRKNFGKIPDFDILSEDPYSALDNVKNILIDKGYNDIKIKQHSNIGELVSEHYELIINGDTILFAYKPLSCHSYNTIKKQGINIKIATIDTMLSFYLSFIYINRPYYNKNRILCMAKFLFDVQQKNRLKQKGLLKRFSINCYGKEKTIEEIRLNKSKMFKKLKGKKHTQKYKEWFLKYNPSMKKQKKTKKNKK